MKNNIPCFVNGHLKKIKRRKKIKIINMYSVESYQILYNLFLKVQIVMDHNILGIYVTFLEMEITFSLIL